jgi:hypothetical protein
MWRSKKLGIVAALAVVVLAGSIGGAVVAQNGDGTQPQAQHEPLLGRVCEIYQENSGVAIDQELLKDAFAEAQAEMRTEALQNRLEALVDEGKISEDEAGQYLDWWQSRPDIPVKFGLGGRDGLRGWGALPVQPGGGVFSAPATE